MNKPKLCNAIRPQMLFAIIVLTGSLISGLNAKSKENEQYNGRTFPFASPAQEWADTKLLSQGWCASEVGRFQHNSFKNFHLRAFALQIVRPDLRNPNANHSECSAGECALNYVDNETYVTKHIQPDCHCEHIGPDIDKVKRILKKGGTPLIQISPSSDRSSLKLGVVPYLTGRRYVAISHVWSDGLGNLRGNTLPTCQLGMLKEKARKTMVLSPAFLPRMENPFIATVTVSQHWAGNIAQMTGETSLVWIDTLCVPRERESRDLAIRGMKKAYQNAYKTLVLDSELRSTSVFDKTKEDIIFRVLFCSGWMRRLWTLQEGLAAGTSLCVAFADTILNIPETADKLFLKIERGRFRPLAVSIPAYSQGYWFIWFRTAVEWMSTFHKYWSILEKAIFIRRRKDVIAEDCVLLSFSWNNVAARATSRDEDRSIIFAGIIGMDLGPLLSICGDAEARMKAFYGLSQHFPQGIIFMPGPRFEEDGWRWAVKTCRIQTGALEKDDMDDTPGERRSEGLLVKYPGIIALTERALKPKDMKDSAGFVFKLTSSSDDLYIKVFQDKEEQSELKIPDLPAPAIGILFQQKNSPLLDLLGRTAESNYRTDCVLIAIYKDENNIQFGRFLMHGKVTRAWTRGIAGAHLIQVWGSTGTVSENCASRMWCIG